MGSHPESTGDGAAESKGHGKRPRLSKGMLISTGSVAIALIAGLAIYSTSLSGSDKGDKNTADKAGTVAGVADDCDGEKSASKLPPDGSITVSEKGAYHEENGDDVWFGVVLENTSAELAYHVKVTFKLLDKDCEPMSEEVFRDPKSAPQHIQTVPVIAPGEEEGLGGYVGLADESDDIGGVRIDIAEPASWESSDSDSYLTDRAYASEVIAGIKEGQLNVYLRLNGGGRFISPIAGAGFVYRNAEGRVVGGSPPVQIEDDIDHLSHVTVSPQIPVVNNPPPGTKELSVNIVDAQNTGVYVYPEYFDSESGDLVTPK